MSKWWVYIVECSDGSFYTGASVDVNARVAKHNSGKGAKYTRARLPVKLLASWEHSDKSSALREEARIKKLSRQDKAKLIASGDTYTKGTSSWKNPQDTEGQSSTLQN